MEDVSTRTALLNDLCASSSVSRANLADDSGHALHEVRRVVAVDVVAATDDRVACRGDIGGGHGDIAPRGSDSCEERPALVEDPGHPPNNPHLLGERLREGVDPLVGRRNDVAIVGAANARGRAGALCGEVPDHAQGRGRKSPGGHPILDLLPDEVGDLCGQDAAQLPQGGLHEFDCSAQQSPEPVRSRASARMPSRALPMAAVRAPAAALVPSPFTALVACSLAPLSIESNASEAAVWSFATSAACGGCGTG